MKRICLVASGLQLSRLRLQPWRYLHQVALELQERGHTVTLISDGAAAAEPETLQGVPVQRIPTIANPRWNPNVELHAALTDYAPDVVMWHLGKTSFLHQDFNFPAAINLGVFTSPLYNANELAALGIPRLIKGYQLSAIHVLGTFMPRHLLRKSLDRNRLDGLVVQTKTTQNRLLEYGVRADEITVIAPGVDAEWCSQTADEDLRQELGFTPQDKIIVYFGSPASLRGLPTLMRAFAIARQHDARLKLMILSRRHLNELISEDAQLGRLLTNNVVSPHVHLTSGYLTTQALIRHIAAADIVALPFELVPSDAPLSLLEAQALGKPIITTEIACLSELTQPGNRFLAQPADVPSLVQAIRRATQGPRTGLVGRYVVPPPIRRWGQVGAEWSQFIQSH
jgi:glycosyltransferase involved in cell wall biosynthesis